METKTTTKIKLIIDRFPKGYIFTYSDLNTGVNQKEAVIKALNRMVNAGRIEKISKGRYYKPEITPFGQIQPTQEQVVKDLLGANGKPSGYLSGYSIFSQLGLTTQVSNTIQIGKNNIRPTFKRGHYTISFIKQKNTITKENIPLLQILDAIRFIKKIPDTTIDGSCKRLLAVIKTLPEKEIKKMVRLALKYPPSTRALLGAMLEQLKQLNLAEPLLHSLNPITKYKLNTSINVLSCKKKWNIE